MTDQYPLDDVLRAWIDAGEERLPTADLDAALTEIESTNQRGARWVPLEDFLMRFQPLAASVAIAAVLVTALVALALLTGPPNVGPDPSPTRGATTTPATSATSSPTADPTVPPSQSLSATRVLDADWSVPFTVTIPGTWQHLPESPDVTYYIEAEFARFIALTTQGQESVEGWVSLLTSTPELIVSDPAPAELGSAVGFWFDVALDPAASDEFVLFRDTSASWVISRSGMNRIWVVDVAGETVLIVTAASSRAFEGWASTVTEVLATLEWR